MGPPYLLLRLPNTNKQRAKIQNCQKKHWRQTPGTETRRHNKLRKTMEIHRASKQTPGETNPGGADHHWREAGREGKKLETPGNKYSQKITQEASRHAQ